MLRLLTDSHVPPAVCAAARKLQPLEIIALRDWHHGKHLHSEDAQLLSLAWKERITLVTYDVSTIPRHLKNRAENGLSHAGVIFISRRFGQNAVGRIARALAQLWKNHQAEDWTNRTYFLD